VTLEKLKREYFVHIGNQDCTGDERFRRLLEERTDRAGHHPLPNFPGIHDQVNVYWRKSGWNPPRTGRDEDTKPAKEKRRTTAQGAGTAPCRPGGQKHPTP
jgi:hypothetical protein